MAQEYVLITQNGKAPVVKKPMGTGNAFVIRLLDDCLERSQADNEIRTVICTGDWTGFAVYGEREFRARFADN